jgi:hypothetical protein
LEGRVDVFPQVLVIAGADDRRMAMRMAERVPQNQLGPLHPFGQDFVQSGLIPDVVQRGSLDFRVGTAVSDPASDNDPRSSFRGLSDPPVVFWSEAGVGDLEGIESSQGDQVGKMGEGTGDSQESDPTLVAEAFEQVDEPFSLERFGVAAVELEEVDVVGPQSAEAGLQIPADDVLIPVVVDLEVIFVLSVNAPALGGQVILLSPRTDVATDSCSLSP